MLKSSKNVKMISLYLTRQNHPGTLSNTLLYDTATTEISALEKETTQFAARQLGGEKKNTSILHKIMQAGLYPRPVARSAIPRLGDHNMDTTKTYHIYT
jgi:hypothetical protein